MQIAIKNELQLYNLSIIQTNEPTNLRVNNQSDRFVYNNGSDVCKGLAVNQTKSNQSEHDLSNPQSQLITASLLTTGGCFCLCQSLGAGGWLMRASEIKKFC